MTWQDLQPPSPPGVFGPMVFDAVRDEIVLFGRFPSSETWVFDGTSWVQRFPATVPSARNGHSMIYDPIGGQALMYGGIDPFVAHPFDKINSELWAWDGSNWSLLFDAVAQGSGPGPRAYVEVAFDISRNRLAMYGGTGFSLPFRPPRLTDSSLLQEYWEWDGSQWIYPQSPVSPPTQLSGMELFYTDLFYDNSLERVLLSGGIVDNPSSQVLTFQGMWAWDGASWFDVSHHGVSSGIFFAVDHVARNRIVAYESPPTTTNFFLIEGSAGSGWTPLVGLNSPSDTLGTAVYDSNRDRLVFVGVGNGPGQTSTGTWSLSTVNPATVDAFGMGCASGPAFARVAPTSLSRPWMGDVYPLTVTANSTATLGFMLTGVSRAQWLGMPLPVGLQRFGLAGCDAWIEPLNAEALPLTNGVASWSLAIPSDPALLGATFYSQALVLDPTATNGAQAVVSDALRHVLGRR